MSLLRTETIEDAIRIQEVLVEGYKSQGEVVPLFERLVLEGLKELKAYRDTGLSPEVCMNYKIFEDECISRDVTFKRILEIVKQEEKNHENIRRNQGK